MKKRLLSLVLALATCLSLCTTVFADSDEAAGEHHLEEAEFAATYESFDVEMSDEDIYTFVDPALAAENVAVGRAGSSDYMYSYYKYATHELLEYDSIPLYGKVFLISVARGQTITPEETKTTSAGIGFSGSYSLSLKKALAGKLDANSKFEVTVKVAKKESFTFPSDKQGNSANFYLAVGFDLIKYTYERYDVYRGDGLGGGMGMGNQTYRIGFEDITAHTPKKVIYSITKTYQ